MHNAQGQLRQRLDFKGEQTLQGSFDLRYLPAGTYMMTVTTPAGTLTRQLVKH